MGKYLEMMWSHDQPPPPPSPKPLWLAKGQSFLIILESKLNLFELWKLGINYSQGLYMNEYSDF